MLVSALTGFAFHSSVAARALQLLGPQRVGDLVAFGGGVTIAGLGDQRKPLVRLFQALRHADALGRQDTQVELAVLDAELGGLLEPAASRVVVSGAVGAHREEHSKVVHGAGVALLSRHLVPGLRPGDIALDADALLVEIADAILGRRQSKIGRLLVPFGSSLHVRLQAAALGITRADLEDRLGIAGLGGFAQRHRPSFDRHLLEGDRRRGCSLRRLLRRGSSFSGGLLRIDRCDRGVGLGGRFSCCRRSGNGRFRRFLDGCRWRLLDG